MLTAILYARCAVAGSKDLEEQIRRCRIHAANQSYRLIREYCDDGVSADSLDRDGLNRLRAVIKTGTIDLILITSLSRFAREPEQIKMLLHEIKSAKVTIELAK